MAAVNHAPPLLQFQYHQPQPSQTPPPSHQQLQPPPMPLPPPPPLDSKAQIRLHTWGLLAARDLIVETARHKFYTVPDFKGSARAAFRLMRTDQFQKASKPLVFASNCCH